MRCNDPFPRGVGGGKGLKDPHDKNEDCSKHIYILILCLGAIQNNDSTNQNM